MLILVTHPDGAQQALVGAPTVQGAQRLLVAQTKDSAWARGTAHVPDPNARDTVFWIVLPPDTPRRGVKPAKTSPKSKDQTPDEVTDGADRDDGA